MGDPDDVRLTEEEKRRRRRSIAIALALVAMVVLFYLLTIVRMGPEIFDRSL